MITQTTLTKVLEFEIRLSNLNSRIQVIKLGVQVTPLAEELQVQVNYAMTCRLQIEKGRKEPRAKNNISHYSHANMESQLYQNKDEFDPELKLRD